MSDSNSGLRVESGIELPKRSGGGSVKYPLAKMAVGDSFLIPADRVGPSTRGSVMGSAKRQGVKVSIRIVDGGLRVWRVE